MTNQDAPDRIWIEEDDGCPYFYDASELAEAGGPLIEYIRADLAAPAPVVPAARLARASVTDASAGWTLDFEMLQEFRAAAGDWGYSLDLEAVEQIALAVEARLRSTPHVVARVTWIDIGGQQPPKDQPFLARNPGFAAFIAEWSETDQEYLTFGDADGWCRIQFSHWLPIPDLPAAILPAGEGE